MNRCLVCNKILQDNFNSIFSNNKMCYNCFNKLKRRNKKFKIKGVNGLVLYYYNDFFKDILFRYKGCYDYVLKDVFLEYNLEKLKRKYKGYTLVLAPSNKDREEKRNFNHLESIFLSLNLPIIKCFKKIKKWKQSDHKYEERANIQNVIKIDKSMLNGVERVLIVDDVLTSGSTIKTLISLLPTNIDKKVLVLSSNCRFLKNEFD